jgi:hypothetical protein
VNAVDPGGEVVALDSAGYGAFTVTKSVSVVGPPGLYAGVTATTGRAVTVSVGANEVVVLQGLSITGAGATDGVWVTGTGTVFVDRCVISGFSHDGIGLIGAGLLVVTDTTARQNAVRGLGASVSSGVGRVTVEGSTFEGNGGEGLQAGANSIVTVADSVLSGNDKGAEVASNGEINLQASELAHNATAGLSCPSASGRVRATDLLVVKNGAGFAQANGCNFDTLGDNVVRGNASNVDGTVGPVGFN